MTQGERRLCEWSYGQASGFVSGLMELISRADGDNRKRLAMAFPEEVEAMTLYHTKSGYWENLDVEWMALIGKTTT